MQRRILLAATLLTAALPLRAQTVDIAGVKFQPTAQLGGVSLLLNGAGIRNKVFIKVYATGLYLGSKASTTSAALNQPGPKRVFMVMLREVDGNELGRLFTRGLEDNAPREEFSKFIPGTIKIAEIFSLRKKMLAGDSISIDFVPGLGTTVLVNGKQQGEVIKEPEFFNALLRIWLGNKPADATLKEQLLGQTPNNVGGSPGQQ